LGAVQASAIKRMLGDLTASNALAFAEPVQGRSRSPAAQPARSRILSCWPARLRSALCRFAPSHTGMNMQSSDSMCTRQNLSWAAGEAVSGQWELKDTYAIKAGTHGLELVPVRVQPDSPLPARHATC